MTKGGDSIQIDKGGFVRIHHTILELLANAPLRGQQFRCLMFLLRHTYGYNRKEAKISLKEWADGTGMERHNVWRELQILLRGNVILGETNGPKRPMTWGFNKHHEQWCIESVITDDYKSVVADDYNPKESVVADDYKSVVADDYNPKESVVADDYNPKESVVTSDYKSVVTRSHTRDLKDNKDNTTTTTTEGGSSSGSFEAFSDPHDPVQQCWQENMNSPLTPIVISDLESAVAHYGTHEVIEAIATAVRADNRTMRYVKGVLNRRGSSTNGTTEQTRYVLIPTGDENG